MTHNKSITVAGPQRIFTAFPSKTGSNLQLVMVIFSFLNPNMLAYVCQSIHDYFCIFFVYFALIFQFIKINLTKIFSNDNELNFFS